MNLLMSEAKRLAKRNPSVAAAMEQNKANGPTVTASGDLQFSLPWPPTVNHYWRSLVIKGRVRVVISQDGKEYAHNVLAMLSGRFVTPPGPLAAHFACYPPDNRKRDLDNLCKSMLDALTKAGVWGDDYQVARLCLSRETVVKPAGRVDVTIMKIDQV